MATTYAEARVRLYEIATDISQARLTLTNAVNTVTAIETKLLAMPSKYSSTVTDIEAAATAAPGDAALQALKQEKDKLVAEFQALRPKATEMKNAMTAVVF